jgi:hypothetical protein
MTIIRVLKIVGRSAAYCGYLSVAIALLIYLIFWRGYLKDANERYSPIHREFSLHPFRHVDETTMRLVGFFPAMKEGSFPNFSEEKPPGTTRICTLGESFTYGDEVGPNHDFPNLLQRRFAREGYNKVEVINFGASWHGFHQAFILYDRVGSKFDCDILVVGPMCFFPQRDTRFNHTQGAFPGYLHSRFILRGDEVEQIDSIGKDGAARFESYVSFFPAWIYLRYDRDPPHVLRADETSCSHQPRSIDCGARSQTERAESSGRSSPGSALVGGALRSVSVPGSGVSPYGRGK